MKTDTNNQSEVIARVLLGVSEAEYGNNYGIIRDISHLM